MIGIVSTGPKSKAWIEEHVQSEGWQWLGGVLWGDWRMMETIVEAMLSEGIEDFEALVG